MPTAVCVHIVRVVASRLYVVRIRLKLMLCQCPHPTTFVLYCVLSSTNVCCIVAVAVCPSSNVLVSRILPFVAVIEEQLFADFYISCRNIRQDQTLVVDFSKQGLRTHLEPLLNVVHV